MTSPKSSRPNLATCIVIVGLIASCISIFAFVTDRQSIRDVITTPIIQIPATNRPSSMSTSTFEPVPAAKGAPPVLSTPTPAPTPMMIDSNNPAVSIIISDSASGAISNIRLQFLSGGQPLRDVGIEFYDAKQDITGKWTLVDLVIRNGATVSGGTDANGIYEDTLLPGNYGAWNRDYSANWNQLNGLWGMKANYLNWKDPYETILFPIRAGKLTTIKVSLARLEIGLLASDGSAAKNMLVYLYCQGQDVAGTKIPINCDDGENIHKIDNTGLTVFNLGPGVYVIEVVDPNTRDGKYDFYDIKVQAGESRRELFTLGN